MVLCILMHTDLHLIEGEGMRTTLNIEDELLAKAAMLTGVPLWTLDKRLNEVAIKLGLAP